MKQLLNVLKCLVYVIFVLIFVACMNTPATYVYLVSFMFFGGISLIAWVAYEANIVK